MFSVTLLFEVLTILLFESNSLVWEGPIFPLEGCLLSQAIPNSTFLEFLERDSIIGMCLLAPTGEIGLLVTFYTCRNMGGCKAYY